MSTVSREICKTSYLCCILHLYLRSLSHFGFVISSRIFGDNPVTFGGQCGSRTASVSIKSMLVSLPAWRGLGARGGGGGGGGGAG